MAEMERRYAGRAEFVLLYTREYNPGIGRFRDVTDPTTLEGRLTLARRLKADLDAAFFVALEPEARARPAPASGRADGLWVDIGGAPPRPPAPPAHLESPVVAAPPASSLQPPASSLRSFTFGVAGMVCQGCAISV